MPILPVNSISQPWRSGSWRYFLRDSFPGGVADLEDPTHRGRHLGWEDPLEQGMATHCSILAWRIPGTVEPGGLPSMGLHRIRHD